MIQFEKVTKAFGRNTLFENLELYIADSERVSFFGRSGCGKTTVMNLIMGTQIPDKGVVTTVGRVSAVFQEDRLFPSFNLLENIKAVCDDEEKAIQALRMVYLDEETFTLMPHELSGGMARRAAIARALSFTHDILLLDEPFNGIDEQTKIKIIDNIKQCEKGSIILVSHNINECRMLTDRMISL